MGKGVMPSWHGRPSRVKSPDRCRFLQSLVGVSPSFLDKSAGLLSVFLYVLNDGVLLAPGP